MLEKERDYTRNFLSRSLSVVSWLKLVEVVAGGVEKGVKGDGWVGWKEGDRGWKQEQEQVGGGKEWGAGGGREFPTGKRGHVILSIHRVRRFEKIREKYTYETIHPDRKSRRVDSF